MFSPKIHLLVHLIEGSEEGANKKGLTSIIKFKSERVTYSQNWS